ncbi:helix-turn-helix domain-containing protein [Clostridium kluyveri]|uniref:Predicted phage transcriptional regulator n=1 Tax=Clostridium kluyveri (strain ATCC 8527 / DSM 555 / NBRC 12016 / NCIMB 10680 / K1) TaxID=431943 RepID=A5N9B0_CLOK5|nr:transcriptional regulator [Clostridium kluyveri]EDK33891.1 Predicted phage transcriptional regulator [Clostridium kluyveri DSM 555]
MNIGENIKRIRTQKGLTQKELAKSIHVTPTTIQNYENNRRKPSVDTLDKIAKVLGVTINSFTFNYNFCYELLMRLIKVLNTENYFDLIEKESGIPKSILIQITSQKTDDIDINIDSQIKMLELLFVTNKPEFQKFYLDTLLFNQLEVDNRIQNFMMAKLNTTMKIQSAHELMQESKNYGSKVFEKFKAYLNAFFQDRKKLLSSEEVDIIYNISISILIAIDQNIISFKKGNMHSSVNADSIEILSQLDKNISNLLEYEFDRINNYTTD